MSDTGTKSGTEFFYGDGADLDAMARLGLGGIAVAGGRGFFGSMAINLATLSKVAEADTITEETRICMTGLMARLSSIGGAKKDIIKITAFSDKKEFIPEMWAALDEFFDGEHKPKRITIVAGVAVDCNLEFEVVVRRGEAAAA